MDGADPGPPQASTRRGLRLLDLAGFVAGFGLAAVLVRTVVPRAADLAGPPLVALGLEFMWLGVAMSGPILLGLDPRRPTALPPPRPSRPGRRIGEVAVTPRSERSIRPTVEPVRIDYSRAEWAWLMIGGYWIALTFFVVPARATSVPWSVGGLAPVIGIVLLLRWLPHRSQRSESVPALGWTHHVAVGLLWTWPVAWALLYLLGRTF